jgi:PAS domain-containing protein
LGKSKISLSFVGILEDISWRKQAEESLQRSEERYVLAVKGSNDGLWDYDMTANKVFYSPRYKHMLRLDLTEIDDSFDVFESRLHPSHKGRSIRFSIVSPLSFPLVFC